MSDLADLFQYWGNDLQPGPTGDILPAFGLDRSSQRIIRRLLTNPGGGDYPWEPNYGAGLPAKIGSNLDFGFLSALINGQIALEPTVARSPPPQINLQQITGGVFISIFYFDTSGSGKALGFQLFPTSTPANTFPIPQLEAPTPPSPHQLPPVQGNQVIGHPSNPVPSATGF